MDTVLTLLQRNEEKARFLGTFVITTGMQTPLIYVDVGAAWGIDNPLIRPLAQNGKIRVVGFEPDPAEFAKLRAAFPDDLYFPFGVGDEDGERTFYLCKAAANSSFLEPDLDAFSMPLRREQFVVASTPKIATRRFDSLIRQGLMPAPDFVKIDAQGFEYNILQGFGDELEKVLGIRLETQLRPMYKGQKLLGDILTFMRSRGFILRDIRPMYPDLHEVVEVEVYFSRQPSSVGERFSALKVWELLHDIPPGRTVAQRPDGVLDWQTLPL